MTNEDEINELMSTLKEIVNTNHALLKNCGGHPLFVKKVTEKEVSIKYRGGKRKRIKKENILKYFDKYELCFIKID